MQKEKKKQGKTFIAKNLVKQSYFVGKDGKAREVKSAITGLKEEHERNRR